MSDLYDIDVEKILPPAKKGFTEAQWGSTASGLGQPGNISLEARSSSAKSLTPKQAYELSIAARACIDKIGKSIAKASWRLFTREGVEIVGGPAYDLLRRPARRIARKRWVTDLVITANYSGEVPVQIIDGPEYPVGLRLLDPYRLEIDTPSQPNTIDEILQWRYSPYHGALEYIRADKLIYDRMFNPNASLRALSPFVTGNTEVGTAHESSRYRKQFFENAGIPSHLVVLPEGTPKSQRDDFERRYLSQYGNINNNAHKVMVVSGKDVKVEKLEEPFQNTPFLDLSTWSTMQIALLFGVPPAVLQFDSTTKFDNANEQRMQFVEDTLMPQMELLQEVFQLQLIDPWFTFSPIVRTDAAKKNRPKMTKALAERFEVARERDSDIILLLDPDTMPIVAQVKAAQIAAAKDMRDVLMLSPAETAKYYDFDIEDRPERDEIYLLNNYNCVTNQQIQDRINPPKPEPTLGKPGDPTKPRGKGKKPAKAASKKKAFKRLARHLRRLALQAMDSSEVFALAEADALPGADDFRHEIRVIRHQTKALLGSPDPARATKDFFNHLSLPSEAYRD